MSSTLPVTKRINWSEEDIMLLNHFILSRKGQGGGVNQRALEFLQTFPEIKSRRTLKAVTSKWRSFTRKFFGVNPRAFFDGMDNQKPANHGIIQEKVEAKKFYQIQFSGSLPNVAQLAELMNVIQQDPVGHPVAFNDVALDIGPQNGIPLINGGDQVAAAANGGVQEIAGHQNGVDAADVANEVVIQQPEVLIQPVVPVLMNRRRSRSYEERARLPRAGFMRETAASRGRSARKE